MAVIVFLKIGWMAISGFFRHKRIPGVSQTRAQNIWPNEKLTSIILNFFGSSNYYTMFQLFGSTKN